jgi:hypothetical protein
VEYHDRQGYLVSSLEEIHGLEPGSFGGTVDDFKRDIHPEDWKVTEAAIERVLRTKSEYHIVLRDRTGQNDGLRRLATWC